MAGFVIRAFRPKMTDETGALKFDPIRSVSTLGQLKNTYGRL